MRNKARLKKLLTKHSLAWSLKIGNHLGTLNHQKAIQLANVKPIIFHRWVTGKLAAPVSKLDRIKHHAFDVLRKKRRKLVNDTLASVADEEIIKARFLWKNQIFDQLNMVGKHRFCARCRKVHR